MQRSTSRILTTHTGSLPRPADLVAMLNAKELGEPYDKAAFAARVQRAIAEVVRPAGRRPASTSIGDGEHSKFNWMAYARARLSGLEEIDSPVRFRGATRDSIEFAGAYEDLKIMHAARSGALVAKRTARPKALVCAGPIRYVGQDELRADLDNLKAALAGVNARGSLRHRDLAVEPRALLREPILRLRRGISRGACRRDARGVSRDRRCRLRAADRRSAHGDALQPRGRGDGRGLPQVHRAARRGAEPRVARHPARTRCASTPATASTSRRACTISS